MQDKLQPLLTATDCAQPSAAQLGSARCQAPMRLSQVCAELQRLGFRTKHQIEQGDVELRSPEPKRKRLRHRAKRAQGAGQWEDEGCFHGLLIQSEGLVEMSGPGWGCSGRPSVIVGVGLRAVIPVPDQDLDLFGPAPRLPHHSGCSWAQFFRVLIQQLRLYSVDLRNMALDSRLQGCRGNTKINCRYVMSTDFNCESQPNEHAKILPDIAHAIPFSTCFGQWSSPVILNQEMVA